MFAEFAEFKKPFLSCRDQQITQDVDRFCNQISQLSPKIIIQPFLIAYYTPTECLLGELHIQYISFSIHVHNVSVNTCTLHLHSMMSCCVSPGTCLYMYLVY